MYFSSVDIDEIVKHLPDDQVQESVYVIMLAEEELFSATSLVDLFNLKGATFAGGIFPKLIYEGKLLGQGVIINRYPGKGKCFVLEEYQKGPEIFEPMIEHVKEFHPTTAFVFIDGLSGCITDYLNSLYRYVGSGAKYIGGGAGTSDMLQKPVLFSDKGLIEDGMVVMFTQQEVQPVVKHGWKPFKGPLLITETEGNRVKSINWKEAYLAYKEALGRYASSMTPENFREKSARFPLGLYREDNETVIRTPIAVSSNKEITCMGNVDDNALVYIMNGSPATLRKAAGEAARESILLTDKTESLLVLESVSRYWFLGKDIKREIHAIQEAYLNYPGRIKMSGALSLGAVASQPSGYPDFFSKSVLIGAIHG